MSKIIIGKAGKRNIGFEIAELLVSRLLVQANSGGGKSFLLRRILEQAYGKVQCIVIDPAGEFATLREKFGYVLVGEHGETPVDIRSAGLVAEKLLELRASADPKSLRLFGNANSQTGAHPMLSTQFTITSAGAAVLSVPQVEPDPQVKPKFDGEFIERRMREHRQMQEQTAAELEYDIMREVLLANRGQQ